jgi:hypothetical protein
MHVVNDRNPPLLDYHCVDYDGRGRHPLESHLVDQSCWAKNLLARLELLGLPSIDKCRMQRMGKHGTLI